VVLKKLLKKVSEMHNGALISSTSKRHWFFYFTGAVKRAVIAPKLTLP